MVACRAILLSLALSVSPAVVLAQVDSGIEVKGDFSITATGQAVVNVITGNATAFSIGLGSLGLLGLLGFLRRRSVSIKNAVNVGGNITVEANNHSTASIKVIHQTFKNISNETTQLLFNAQANEKALKNFLTILEASDTPPEAYEDKLQEIAKNYQALQTQANKIHSDNEAVTQLVTQAKQAIEDGEFAQAKTLLDQAEEKAQSEMANQAFITQAEILATKGALANTEIKYLEAAKAYEKAADKLKALDEPDYKELTDYLNRAAGAYREAGLFPTALPLFQQALQLREKHLTDELTLIAESLNNLALLYENQGKFEMAEPLFVQALAISKKALGKEHPSVATTLNNLAALYRAQRKWEKAERLFLQALYIRTKILGEEYPDVASTLNNLAGLYREQGKLEQAESFYLQALGIVASTLGEEHPKVATTLNNLALLYQAQGKFKKAESFYLQDLAISKKVLGEDHPNVATSLHNLAFLYFKQEKYQEALPLTERVLKIRKEKLGNEHPHTNSTQRLVDALKAKLNP